MYLLKIPTGVGSNVLRRLIMNRGIHNLLEALSLPGLPAPELLVQALQAVLVSKDQQIGQAQLHMVLLQRLQSLLML